MRYDDVRWGIDQCETDGCFNDAELVIEPFNWAVCIQCAETIIERRLIVEEYGHDALKNLPPIGEWFEQGHPIIFLKEETDDA